MLKEKKSAIGDLIILLKSQIIWDSKGQDPIVSVEQAGEPCYNYVREQHAKFSVTGKRTRAHLELSHPHQRETLIVLRGARTHGGFSQLPQMPHKHKLQPNPDQFPSSFVMLLF